MKKVELHIVLDRDGVSGVQIIGPPDVHPEGHKIYFKIRDLVQEFDKSVQIRIKEGANYESEDNY